MCSSSTRKNLPPPPLPLYFTSLFTHVMLLLLIWINVQYSRNVIFSIAQGLKVWIVKTLLVWFSLSRKPRQQNFLISSLPPFLLTLYGKAWYGTSVSTNHLRGSAKASYQGFKWNILVLLIRVVIPFLTILHYCQPVNRASRSTSGQVRSWFCTTLHT